LAVRLSLFITRKEDALIWDRPRVEYHRVYFGIRRYDVPSSLDRGLVRVISAEGGTLATLAGMSRDFSRLLEISRDLSRYLKISRDISPRDISRYLEPRLTGASGGYRGTSLIKKRPPLGPYSSICLGPYGVPSGGGSYE